MSVIPTPLQTVLAVAKGYLPRVFQARGWVLAGLAIAPVALALLVITVLRVQGANPVMLSKVALQVFHGVMVKFMVPIMALVAAPAGIREDLEQRTLPLMLVRPAPTWALPIGKGIIWFGWGALWLVGTCLGLMVLGVDPAEFPRQAAALIFAYWAELAFITLLGLIFKRGTLWGALYLFIWERAVHILPGNTQRLTFVHYVESITGSRGSEVGVQQLLAQTQIATPLLVSLLVLAAFGLLCWAASGWKLQQMPVGLAGAETEG